MRIFLPAVFLLILGVGNIFVGTFKRHQYEDVLKELKKTTSEIISVPTSPLRRIQLEEVSSDRTAARQTHAKSKIEFYRLVSFGGELFVAAGAALLLIDVIRRLFCRDKESPSVS